MHRTRPGLKFSRDYVLLLAFAVIPFLPWIDSFFYYDDGYFLTLAQMSAAGNWQQIVGFGFNGHFRPLPILTGAITYYFAGAHSPIAFHLVALALHCANVLLMYRLLLALVPASLRRAAFFAAAIFSIHWAGSEAVTYFAAIGILWSMLGGLIAALSAARCLTSPSPLPWIGFNLGLMISFGGGEYAAATLPFIAATLLWIYFHGSSARPLRRLFLLGLNVFFWLALYIGFEISHQRPGRLGGEYSLGAHILGNVNVTVARTSFPTPWINAGVSLCLACAIALGLLICKILRPRSLPGFALGATLFAVGLVSALPFAPSHMGNFLRFAYFGAAFWALGQILVCLALARSRRAVTAIILCVGGFLVAVNLLHLQLRMVQLTPRLRAVKDAVAATEKLLRDAAPAQVWLMNPDINGIGSLLLARHAATNAQVHWSEPSLSAPGDQTQILLWSSWDAPYFEFQILPPASTGSVSQ